MSSWISITWLIATCSSQWRMILDITRKLTWRQITMLETEWMDRRWQAMTMEQASLLKMISSCSIILSNLPKRAFTTCPSSMKSWTSTRWRKKSYILVKIWIGRTSMRIWSISAPITKIPLLQQAASTVESSEATSSTRNMAFHQWTVPQNSWRAMIRIRMTTWRGHT